MNVEAREGLGLPHQALVAAFPFHIAFDRKLCIRQVGEVLQRTSRKVRPGAHLSETMRILRPLVHTDFDSICEHARALFMISMEGTNLLLKGQMFHLAEADVLLFLGSPWVLEMAQIEQLGLTLGDFAIHDPITDYLFLLQAKNTALGDAQALSKQLELQREALKRSNLALEEERRQLEDKVRMRTRELSLANSDLVKKELLLQEDLAQARSFQQSILPSLPKHDRLELAVAYRPAAMVGGDIYDVDQLDARRFRIFLADATGHGVQASLRTMILKSEYERLKKASSSPARVLSAINRKIVEAYRGIDLHCTACCFDIALRDDGGAHVVYASSAHPPLLQLTANGPIEHSVRGPFFGLAEDVEFGALELNLAPGDRLIAYSDGITEQPGADGSEMGLERLIEAAGGAELGSKAAIAAIVAAFERFLDGAEQADDVTLIAMTNRAADATKEPK